MPLYLNGCTFSNCKVGVNGNAGSEIIGVNNRFNNVVQPIIAHPESKVSLTGTRISDDPKISRLKRARRSGGRSDQRDSKVSRTSVGWQRPCGPPLPAMCPDCGAIFKSNNYNVGSSRFYSQDNREVCPCCTGERAKLVDGFFDLTGDIIRVISAPDVSVEMISSLRVIADDFFTGQTDWETTVKSFDDIGAFKDLEKSKNQTIQGNEFGKFGLAIALLTALGAIATCNLQAESNRISLESNSLSAQANAIAAEANAIAKEQVNESVSTSSSAAVNGNDPKAGSMIERNWISNGLSTLWTRLEQGLEEVDGRTKPDNSIASK